MKRPALLAVLLLPLAAVAHHGTFTYDGNTVVTLEGEVLAFHWTNPHGAIILLTGGPGEMREVEIEIDGPSLIAPMGVDSNSLRPGERIVAYVSPSRTRDHEVLGREVIKEDGSVVRVSVAYARERERAEQPVAESILGAWVPVRTALFDHVASSNDWPLTEAGERSRAAYDVTAPFAHTECIAATAPTLMMYPTANVLTQVGSHIEINADWMGATRTVYMDGRAHPPLATSYYQGHSIGRWEDGGLVVETTNFSVNPIGNIFSIASGPRKQLEERLSLDEGGRFLTYTYTLSDPDYLARPVTASYRWQYRPDVTVSTVACDPEAASRYMRD